MRRLPFFVVCLLFLFAINRSQAEEASLPPAPSDDAAVWYLTAQNELTAVFDEQVQILLGNDASPQDETSKANAIEALQTPLAYIRRGALLERCTWPVDLKMDGPTARLYHLNTMRLQADLLTNIAWFHAEQPGKQDAVIADALAVMRMARHTSTDGTLISTLTQYKIEGDALGVLSFHLHRFDREQLQQLQEALDAMPARRSVHEAIAGERMLVDWLEGIRQKQGADALIKMTGELADSPELREALKGLDADGVSQRVMAWLTELDEMYTQISDNLAMPLDAFKRADKVFVAKLVKTQNPFARILVPSVAAAREREEQANVSGAILSAMIAYRLKGEAGFNAVTDPTDGKPFTFDTDDGHLTVNARLINRHGIPVRLLFSPEAKKLAE